MAAEAEYEPGNGWAESVESALEPYVAELWVKRDGALREKHNVELLSTRMS